MAARNCTSRKEVRELIATCKAKRRVPSSLLHRAANISNSPLIKAIAKEAANEKDRLIRSIWSLIVAVISLDRNPAVTLLNIQE